jgi:hypothetical protein
MKTFLLLFLIFLPITLFGQQLSCCETIKDVESYLRGYWRKQDSDLNYQFQFKNESGSFKFYSNTTNGLVEEAQEHPAILTILKKENGFQIKHDFGLISAYNGIKYLDSLKLIVTRRDGKEIEYHKISE